MPETVRGVAEANQGLGHAALHVLIGRVEIETIAQQDDAALPGLTFLRLLTAPVIGVGQPPPAPPVFGAVPDLFPQGNDSVVVSPPEGPGVHGGGRRRR